MTYLQAFLRTLKETLILFIFLPQPYYGVCLNLLIHLHERIPVFFQMWMAKPCSSVLCLNLLCFTFHILLLLAGAYKHLVIFGNFAVFIENLFSFSFGVFVSFKLCKMMSLLLTFHLCPPFLKSIVISTSRKILYMVNVQYNMQMMYYIMVYLKPTWFY